MPEIVLVTLCGVIAGAAGSEAIERMSNCALHRHHPAPYLQTYEEADKGHGRIEIRRCAVTADSAWLQEQHAWPGLQRMARITATRIIGATSTTEGRYYLSDDTAGPMRMRAKAQSLGY